MFLENLNTNISGVENKISDHTKYITTQEFNNLTTENLKTIWLLTNTPTLDILVLKKQRHWLYS